MIGIIPFRREHNVCRFSKDKNSKMSKEYFYSTYEDVYQMIKGQEKSYYYEDCS